MIKKEEEKLQRYIGDRMKSYFFKKVGLRGASTEKNTFGTFNPLTSHLYFKISIKYIRMFLSNLKILF